MRTMILIMSTICLMSCGRNQPNVSDYFDDPEVIELIKAANEGDAQRIRELVRSGVDVNYRGKSNFTPLYWVVVTQKPIKLDVYETLLKSGADPNIIHAKGRSVMFLTAQISDPTYLELALQYGGDVNLKHAMEPSEPTPIFHAILNLHYEHVKKLVIAGADIELRNDKEETPLLFAAALNQWQIVDYLLQHGANYEAVNNNGNTIVWFIENNRIDKSTTLYKEREKVMRFLRKRRIKLDPWEPN